MPTDKIPPRQYISTKREHGQIGGPADAQNKRKKKYPEIRDVLVSQLPPNIVGPIVLLEGGAALGEPLLAKGINPSRLIYVNSNDSVTAYARQSQPASLAIESNLVNLPKALADNISEPVGAIISNARVGSIPFAKRMDVFKQMLELLRPEGLFIHANDLPNDDYPAALASFRKIFTVTTRIIGMQPNENHFYTRQIVISIFRASKLKEFAKYYDEGIDLSEQFATSEGLIDDKLTPEDFKKAFRSSVVGGGLPDVPKKFWTGDYRGKAKSVVTESLISFLEDVYGDYMPQHRNEMRTYLRKHDPGFLAFLKNFGFQNLPDKFQMPSTRQKVRTRLERAASGEYENMTETERRSVRGRLLRSESRPKKIPH